MEWILSLLLTVKLVLASSFQGIQPVSLSLPLANPDNSLINPVNFWFQVIEAPSRFSQLPTDVQIAIFFEYLRPGESLRLRAISGYHRQLIDFLAKQRCLLNCGPQMFSNRVKLQVAFAINHLQLLKATFPRMPSDLGEESILLLCVLAYFMNVPDFDVAADRIAHLQVYFNDFVFFFTQLQLVRNRWQLFLAVSDYLHKMALPLPLQVLYYHCMGASDAVKKVLLEHSCAHRRDNFWALFNDSYFSTISVAEYLQISLKSHNPAVILYVLDRYELSLPATFNGIHILRYCLSNNVYDAALAERIDFTAVPLLTFKDCLRLIVLPGLSSFEWLLQILQRAPEEALNEDYQDLKEVFIRRQIPQNLGKKRQDSLVLKLLALGRVDDVVLAILKEFLPTVEPGLSAIVTGLASQTTAFTEILMLENGRLEPTFLCPTFFKADLEPDLVIKGIDGHEHCVFTKIVANLGRKVLGSRWFRKVYLLLVEHGLLLEDLQDQFQGAEALEISLCDLQSRVSKLDWFHPDFAAHVASSILARQQWSFLELSIVFLNPAAVRLCLQGPEGGNFFAENRESVLELAKSMLEWVRGSGFKICAQAIYSLLSGIGIRLWRNNPEKYMIIDERTPVHYETVPITNLINS